MYYLKTNDEDSLWETLFQAGLAEEIEIPDLDGVKKEKVVKSGVSLDVIGKIQKPTGETREEQPGMIVPVFADIEGFHANLMVSLELTEQQEQLISSISIDPPATPYRVWYL